KLLSEMKKEFPNYKYEKYIEKLDDTGYMEDVEVQVTYGPDVTAERLDKMPALKWIHVMQSGLNSIPFNELIKRGIILTSSKGINSVTIAEYTIGMMLNIIRNSFVYYDAQKRNEWDVNTNLDELKGKTLGILGYGSVGVELAKRAKPFDMKIIATKRNFEENLMNVDEIVKMEDVEYIFKESDFVISLLPESPSTKRLIDAQEIAMMKSTACLINVSRRRIVDESALVKALENGTIGSAVLVVFDEEPLPENNKLWNVKNLLITPHIAGDRHPNYKTRAFEILFENLKKYTNNKQDEMINIIDKSQGY